MILWRWFGSGRYYQSRQGVELLPEHPVDDKSPHPESRGIVINDTFLTLRE
jgi:hypothetical protein